MQKRIRSQRRGSALNQRDSSFLRALEIYKCPNYTPLSKSEEQYIFRLHSRFFSKSRSLRSALRKASEEDKGPLKARIAQVEKAQYRIESVIARLNRRLVCSIVAGVLKAKKVFHLQFDDLVNEGDMIQQKVIRRFDYTRGFRYGTYASWWIRQAVTRAINDQERQVRLPVHICDAISKALTFMNDFSASNRRNPTFKEISQGTGINEEKVRFILSVQLRQADLGGNQDGESEALLDIVLSQRISRETPFEQVSKAQSKMFLFQLINHLKPIEREILERRYGLNGKGAKEETLEEVGKVFNLTRERIRQLQQKAILKLRTLAESRNLDLA